MAMTSTERVYKWRRLNPERFKEAVRKRAPKLREKHRLLKVEVLTRYGNGRLACIGCGFGDIRALSLDHIYGREMNDKTARKKGKKIEAFAHLCRRLKEEGYPEGFQTLCMNCQWIKRHDNREYMKLEYR